MKKPQYKYNLHFSNFHKMNKALVPKIYWISVIKTLFQ